MDFQTDILGNLLEELIDYRGKTPVKTISGIPLVTAKIIKNGVINEFTEFIAESDYDRWMVRGFPKSGDVVLTTEAPLGEVAQLDDRKIALAQRVVCLRGKSNILDNTYLKYYFLSRYGKKSLKSRESGTTVTGIKQSELRNVEVRYPSYQDQCSIASILSSLDDKIAINRRICENLEAQAQALFKHWFIDFAPFKDGQFVESQLGMIPEGWRVGTLGDLVRQVKKKVGDEDVKVLSPINTGELVLSDEYFTKQVYSKSISKYILVEPNDFAYNPARVNIGSIGRNEFDFTGCVSPVYVVFHCKEHFHYYIDFLRKTQNFKKHVSKLAIGGVRQTLRFEDMARIPMVIPPTEFVVSYNNIYESMYVSVKHLLAESSRLSTLRDTLLPKLMSGQIKV